MRLIVSAFPVLGHDTVMMAAVTEYRTQADKADRDRQRTKVFENTPTRSTLRVFGWES